MSRKLTTHVTLLDDNGDRHTFGPDDTVPAEFAKRITNPDAWDTPPAEDDAHGKGEDDDEPKGKAPQRRSS